MARVTTDWRWAGVDEVAAVALASPSAAPTKTTRAFVHTQQFGRDMQTHQPSPMEPSTRASLALTPLAVRGRLVSTLICRRDPRQLWEKSTAG